ncbi:hypothetical protein ACFLWU_00950 [Chloroflexota bacterium]
MARASHYILKETTLKIKLVYLMFAHPEVGKGKVDQSDEVYYGEDDGTDGGMLPGKLVQQQPGRTDDNQDKSHTFNKVSHLNANYNMNSIIYFSTRPPSFIHGLARRFLFPYSGNNGEPIPHVSPLSSKNIRGFFR